MGKQSSRIYFGGGDHKEVYFDGHYHDKMYIGGELVWEKRYGLGPRPNFSIYYTLKETVKTPLGHLIDEVGMYILINENSLVEKIGCFTMDDRSDYGYFSFIPFVIGKNITMAKCVIYVSYMGNLVCDAFQKEWKYDTGCVILVTEDVPMDGNIGILSEWWKYPNVYKLGKVISDYIFVDIGKWAESNPSKAYGMEKIPFDNHSVDGSIEKWLEKTLLE